MIDKTQGGDALTVRLGHFRLDKLLGHGAFGTVYRATDLHLHRSVAIKVLDPSMLVNDKVRQRFFREARILAALDHAAIVRIFYAGSSDRGPYYAMELLTGGSLRRMLKRLTTLEERIVAQLLEDLLAGLGTLHDAGVVHRDLKPANILFTDGGRAKIADFGLALEESSARLTTVGSVLGTPPYLAPEQWQGVRTSVAADLYALGVIAYECLTGRLPFHSKSLPELANRVCNEPVDMVPLRSVPNAELWTGFLTPLLAKDPAARPESAWATLNKLRPLRSGRSSGTAIEGVPSHMMRPAETPEAAARTVPTDSAPAVEIPSWSDSPGGREPKRSSANAEPSAGDPQRYTRASVDTRTPAEPPAPSATSAPPSALPPAEAPSPATPRERILPLLTAGVALIAWVIAGFLAYDRRLSTAEVEGLQGLVAQLEEEKRQLEVERRRLSVRNVEFRAKLTNLTNKLFPASEPFAWDTHLTVEVAGAQCGVRFSRPTEEQPHVAFELHAFNTTTLSLPGTVEVTVLGEAGERIGQARVNLLRGTTVERLEPGGQRTVRGSLRLPTRDTVPARFSLAFVEGRP